jgi:hypothetical protein
MVSNHETCLHPQNFKKNQTANVAMILQLLVALFGLDGIVPGAAQGVGTVRSHLNFAELQMAIA